MKRMTSKDLLVQSFHGLADQKPVDQITVQIITSNCGYSPAAFYRQFRDKYDLIAWDYQSHCSAMMRRIGTAEGSAREMAMLEGIAYLLEQKDYLCNLLKHSGGQDSFRSYMAEVNKHLLAETVCSQIGKKAFLNNWMYASKCSPMEPPSCSVSDS